MLHDTEGTWQAALSMFQNPSLRVSAHYLLPKDGRIIQMVKDVDIAYHAIGTWSMLPDCIKLLTDPIFCSRINAYTIGIELELLKGETEYTDSQYKALNFLLPRLCSLHTISYDRNWIMGHGELQSDRSDPRNFLWDRIGL